MKKIMLGSYMFVALLAVFQMEAVGKNGAGANPNAGQQVHYTTSGKILGDNPSTWAPSEIQLEILRLSREFSQASKFMQDLAQGLASLKQDDPDTFEEHFGDTGSRVRRKNFASDLESSLQIAE